VKSFILDFLPEYSDTAIMDELRRVAAAAGGNTLIISEFSKHSKVGLTTVRRRFGSWPLALEAAGLGHLYNRPAAATKSRTLARTLSDDELLEELRCVAQSLGSATLTADQIRQHAPVGVDSLRNRFGSLRAALRAAGLTEVAHGRRYSDEECFGNLLSVWTHYGRAPAHAEMSLPPSVVGPKAYTSRWGGWRAALFAFVARMEGPDEVEPESKSALIPSRPPKRDPEDRHGIPLSLRYKVLKRDSFRCVQCGASPALTLGVELHVDHIVAFTNGGKTLIENLRTLCKGCNLGKGAT
jgi:hypothetical protein